MKTIIFDESSYKWDKNPELNSLLLKQELRWLEEQFNHRGYIYLNQVYENLDVEWDPNDENVCYKKENGLVKFCYELIEFNAYMITITQ